MNLCAPCFPDEPETPNIPKTSHPIQILRNCISCDEAFSASEQCTKCRIFSDDMTILAMNQGTVSRSYKPYRFFLVVQYNVMNLPLNDRYVTHHNGMITFTQSYPLHESFSNEHIQSDGKVRDTNSNLMKLYNIPTNRDNPTIYRMMHAVVRTRYIDLGK
jgi:hypothetical protein